MTTAAKPKIFEVEIERLVLRRLRPSDLEGRRIMGADTSDGGHIILAFDDGRTLTICAGEDDDGDPVFVVGHDHGTKVAKERARARKDRWS